MISKKMDAQINNMKITITGKQFADAVTKVADDLPSELTVHVLMVAAFIMHELFHDEVEEDKTDDIEHMREAGDKYCDGRESCNGCPVFDIPTRMCFESTAEDEDVIAGYNALKEAGVI